jgi:hypothetical protein
VQWKVDMKFDTWNVEEWILGNMVGKCRLNASGSE